MVIVLTTTYFPSEKASEVGKRYLEVLKKLPVDRSIQKLIVPVAVKTTKDGLKGISVAEMGKFNEYIKAVYTNILEYFDIQGYHVEIEFFMSGAEALPLVGLKMPEV